MHNILNLCDGLLYVESENWQCSFGHGNPIKLGLVLEAVKLGGGEEYSFVVDASLIPQPGCLDEEILEEAEAEGAKSKEEKILYAYECYGGVPVNIDALQPPKASCGFSSFVADSSIAQLRSQGGDVMEVRHFENLEEAMSFSRDFYAVYAQMLFGFIDVVLDSTLRTGKTGWDKIRQMAKK